MIILSAALHNIFRDWRPRIALKLADLPHLQSVLLIQHVHHVSTFINLCTHQLLV